MYCKIIVLTKQESTSIADKDNLTKDLSSIIWVVTVDTALNCNLIVYE